MSDVADVFILVSIKLFTVLVPVSASAIATFTWHAYPCWFNAFESTSELVFIKFIEGSSPSINFVFTSFLFYQYIYLYRPGAQV